MAMAIAGRRLRLRGKGLESRLGSEFSLESFPFGYLFLSGEPFFCSLLFCVMLMVDMMSLVFWFSYAHFVFFSFVLQSTDFPVRNISISLSPLLTFG